MAEVIAVIIVVIWAGYIAAKRWQAIDDDEDNTGDLFNYKKDKHND